MKTRRQPTVRCPQNFPRTAIFAVAALAALLASAGQRGFAEGNPATIQQLTVAAERGEVEAQSSLGAKYMRGDGVERDYAKAMKWLSKAAEQGDVLAAM